jgi:hypothetical protein
MYELKQNGKVLRANLLGRGPRLIQKKHCYTVRSLLGSIRQPGTFVGAVILAEGKGAILWISGSGLTAASMLGDVVSIPTSPYRRRIPWGGVRGCPAYRSVCNGWRRLAGFCVTAHLWELCRVWLCYHINLVSSGTGVVCRFFHTDSQSVDGHSLAVRITWQPVSTCNRILMVSYTLRLNDMGDSLCPGGSTYDVSSAKRRR